MSRIGKQPIPVPSGVKVAVNAASRTVNIEGPKGKLQFVHRPEVKVAFDEASKAIVCTLAKPEYATEGNGRAYWGTTRSCLTGMVEGVSKGYERKLEIVGVGWGAKLQGKKLVLTVGYCDPIPLTVPDGVTVAVDNNVNVTVTGVDKQKVGAFASLIRSQRKPEPYNGKGVKYSDEVIQRKQGKAFGA